jgi:hypothetical protein
MYDFFGAVMPEEFSMAGSRQVIYPDSTAGNGFAYSSRKRRRNEVL